MQNSVRYARSRHTYYRMTLAAVAFGSALAALRQVAAQDSGYSTRAYLESTEVTEVALTPDGRDVAFITTRDNFDLDRTESAVWRLSLDGPDHQPRIVIGGLRGASSIRWSPDGKWLAFVQRPWGDAAPAMAHSQTVSQSTR